MEDPPERRTPDAPPFCGPCIDVDVGLHQVDIQRAAPAVPGLPGDEAVSDWIRRVLQLLDESASEVSVRLVDEHDMADLNRQYRGKPGPTNVLSFPAGFVDENGRTILGDIVLCTDVIVREARQQDKSVEAHFAHMVVHGLLHLKGHDHVKEDQAAAMEKLEIHLMKQLGFADPYEEALGRDE